MIIASAQLQVIEHDTDANIQKHLLFIEAAAQKNAGLILFPEMSLTGYERELAEGLSFSENDPRLSVFSEKAVLHKMHIIVGAPVKIGSHLHIGSFIFSPDQSMRIYTKQYLHAGEELYFSPSFDFNPVITVENEKIAIAICSDIANPQHAAAAAMNHTGLYLASIFYTKDGIAEGYERLSNIAKTSGMDVLMANYCGFSYQLEAGGQSAFWDKHGNIIAKAGESSEELLILEGCNGTWKQVLPLTATHKPI
jgi:predicted amidohydrolase